MSVTTEKVRVQLLVLMNLLFVYVSVPMLWGIAILYTAAQRAVGKAQDIDCTPQENYNIEELLDEDPEE